MIAFAAIIVCAILFDLALFYLNQSTFQSRWAISPDESFEPVGRVSRIPYYEDFLSYRNLIIEPLRKKKSVIFFTLYTYNKLLFPAMFVPVRSNSSEKQLKAAMQMYDEASDDDVLTWEE